MGRVGSGRWPAMIRVPFTGKATAQIDGTVVIPGITQATDQGLAIPATGPYVDAVGFLKGAHAVAQDTTQTGTIWTFRDVELIDAIDLVSMEYDQTVANAVAVASTSTTTVTITSLENNIDCSWLYAVSGTGVGKLAFLTASASGSCTTKTATAWDSTTKVIKIHRFGHKLLDVTTGTIAGKIKSAAAAPTGTAFVFEIYAQADQFALTQLNPLLHDNLTLTNARFFARFAFRSNAGR